MRDTESPASDGPGGNVRPYARTAQSNLHAEGRMADNHTDKTIVYECSFLFGGLDLGGGTAGGSDGGTVAIDWDVNISQPACGEAATAEGSGD